MNLMNRSLSAAAWTFGSIVIQAVLQLAVTSILAHFIPPAGFGLFAITSLVVGIIGIFAQVGIGPTIVQRKDLTEPFVNGAFSISFFLGTAGFILTWIASPLIASFFKEPGVVNLLRVSSFVLLISGYTTIALGLLQRELLFRRIAILNVVSYALGYGIIGCGLAVIRKDAWAIVAGSLSQNVIIAIILLIFSGKVPRIQFSKKELRSLLSFSAGVSISQIFANFSNYVDNIVVGRFIGAAALGMYQMAVQIMDLPRRFLGNVIDQVLFVVMSRLQDDRNQMKSGYLFCLRIYNLLLAPIAIVLIIAAPEIIQVILGDQWTGAILPLQILLTQVPLRASVRMADSISTAAGRVYRLSWYKILYTFTIFMGALLGVRWGLVGVAIGITAAVAANWLIMVRFTLQIVGASAREYSGTWKSAFLLSALLAALTLPTTLLLRRTVSSQVARLAGIGLEAAFLFLGANILWPQLAGGETIRLLLDYGKHLPFISSVFRWAEKKFFYGRIPETVENIL